MKNQRKAVIPDIGVPPWQTIQLQQRTSLTPQSAGLALGNSQYEASEISNIPDPSEPEAIYWRKRRRSTSPKPQSAHLGADNSQCEDEIAYSLDPNEPEGIYRMKRLKRVVQLSSSSIYRLEALGLFPKRVKLSASASGWRSRDIHAWIASRPFANPKKGVK